MHARASAHASYLLPWVYTSLLSGPTEELGSLGDGLMIPCFPISPGAALRFTLVFTLGSLAGSLRVHFEVRIEV